MKIDGQYPKMPVQDKSIQKGTERSPDASEFKKSADLKSVGTQKFSINKIKDRIEAEPDINLEKVLAIKEQLKKGDYQVDTQKLANNLIKNSLLEDI
jgi:flagellar biosynthesis anti-sigma factor FlgM